MIKTFRGLLTDGGQNRIRLSTKKGKIGYRIVKFQVIQKSPGAAHSEAVVKIYKILQTSIDALIDFSDGNLLAVAMWQKSDSVTYSGSETIIFDQEIFNQDIYATLDHASGHTDPVNYYLELEMINLTDNAAAVSTLRDIRLNPQVGA